MSNRLRIRSNRLGVGSQWSSRDVDSDMTSLVTTSRRHPLTITAEDSVNEGPWLLNLEEAVEGTVGLPCAYENAVLAQIIIGAIETLVPSPDDCVGASIADNVLMNFRELVVDSVVRTRGVNPNGWQRDTLGADSIIGRLVARGNDREE